MSKNILLTGSNGQLGVAIAKSLFNDQCNIYGMDIDLNTKNKYLKNYLQGSVSDRNSFRNFFKLIELSSDHNEIALINNAGISVFTPSEDRNLEEFRAVTEVNMLGPIYGMTEFYSFITFKETSKV